MVLREKKSRWCREGDLNPNCTDSSSGQDKSKNGLTDTNQTTNDDSQCKSTHQPGLVEPPPGTESGHSWDIPEAADLNRLSEIWPSIPEKIRTSILSLAEASASPRRSKSMIKIDDDQVPTL